MPPVTALLHTHNDARRLGRALETLRCCDHVVILDHESQDGTIQIAREYGASVISTEGNTGRSAPLPTGWILVVEPQESISEGLEASLLEWRSHPFAERQAYSLRIREERSDGWHTLPEPQTRLLPGEWLGPKAQVPGDRFPAISLEGELLRFSFP